MLESQPVVRPSDSDVIRAVERRDEGAVDNLYNAHADSVFRFVYRRLGECYEDAEEVTQDTFLSAINLASTYRRESSVLTWLCGIAKLRITDFYRRRNRDKRVPQELIVSLNQSSSQQPSIPVDSMGHLNSVLFVDEIMCDLSNDEREALLLRYVEQFSVREMSQLMRRSEKGVESILTRAKRRARNTLAGRLMMGSGRNE